MGWVVCVLLYVVIVYSVEKYKVFRNLVYFDEWELRCMLISEIVIFIIGD